jgi:uncharacterized lipoprotein YmbA
MNRLAAIIISCAVAVLTVGCASSPTRFYTLSPTALPAAGPQTGCNVSVGPVSVPAAVDRLQIVVRTGPNQVFINEFDRWASPLKADIARVVAENLASMLGTPQVAVFPASSAAGASYRVMIDVLRFESEPDRAATLDALWTITAVKSGQARRSRTTRTEPTQGGGYAALVAAHSRALGQLSSDIAAAILESEAKNR